VALQRLDGAVCVAAVLGTRCLKRSGHEPKPECTLHMQGPADVKWERFFQDTNAWWDNRTTKRNPKQPDFKHKDECVPNPHPNPT